MSKEFLTNDLYFAGYLMSIDTPFIGLRPDGHRYAFVFEDEDEDLDELKRDWVTGRIEVRRYAYAVRDLKSLVHNAK